MKIIRSVILVFFIGYFHFVFSQSKSEDEFLTPTHESKSPSRVEKRAYRQEKIAYWREKTYRFYLGVDMMLSYRLEPMSFENKPADVHNNYQATTDQGVFSGRLYFGTILKQTNHIEVSFENLPHEIVYDYNPTGKVFGTTEFIDRESYGMLSFCYKRDILKRSKVFKLFPGGFVGVSLNGEKGFLDHFQGGPFVFNNDTTRFQMDKYVKLHPFVVIGPTLDADFNIWHFTIGFKFRLYWEPFVVRGEDIQIWHNSDPVQKFKIESAVLNFNYGVGLRYSF